LVLDRRSRRRGNTLTGGTPRRVLRLSEAGWQAVQQLERGDATTVAARALGRRLIDAGIMHPRPDHRERVTDVTVVIPVRDRPAELDRCLIALGAQVPVIVVDDGSRDAAAVADVARRHGARLVSRPRCGGPAAARNSALSLVETELIAFLDSDCIPEPGWLQALAGHFDDPQVGAVAPRVRALPDPDAGVVGRYLAARSPLDMGGREAGVEPGRRVSYVPTAALLVRRTALAEGFDERLRYGEDVDLIWRLRDAGWRVRYDPATIVRHAEPSGLRQALKRRFHYGTSAAPLADRHRGLLAPAVLTPWPTLLAMLLIGGRRRAAGVVAVQQSALLARRVARLGLPRPVGAWWFGEATYQSLLSLTRYAAMFGLPLVVAAAGRARRPCVLALLALPALEEWRLRAAALDPVRFAALALVDDAAYGAGVWWGCLRTGTVAPLVPATSTIRD
jgi:mycofactocin system glycosyltransferase